MDQSGQCPWYPWSLLVIPTCVGNRKQPSSVGLGWTLCSLDLSFAEMGGEFSQYQKAPRSLHDEKTQGWRRNKWHMVSWCFRDKRQLACSPLRCLRPRQLTNFSRRFELVGCIGSHLQSWHSGNWGRNRTMASLGYRVRPSPARRWSPPEVLLLLHQRVPRTCQMLSYLNIDKKKLVWGLRTVIQTFRSSRSALVV